MSRAERSGATFDRFTEKRPLRRDFPLLCFAAAAAIACPLALFWGRHGWFTQDDWDFLSARTAGNVGDLFRPHFQHWSTLPILLYRLIWVMVGIRSYLPYQVILVVLHLVAASLLLALMRRTAVRPWIATLVAVVFVYFGAGAESILVAFNITFVASLVFGLVQLLLADHDGPLERRDWLGLLAGFLGLLCSGVAVTMAFIVGLAVLLRRGRRGWRVAAFHSVPLGIAYVVWVRFAPKGQSAGDYQSRSPSQVIRFVLIGIQNLFARLGQVPEVGVVLALVLTGGLFVLLRARGRSPLGQYAVPIALLVGGLLFLILAGIQRSGQGGLVAGPERAREGRYVYLSAAMTLPALAVGADALIRRWRRLAYPVVAALLVGIPGNIVQFTKPNHYFELAATTRGAMLLIPRLPLVDQLRHSREPIPAVAFQRFGPEGLTFGWLVDSASSGRIPAPGPTSPVQLSTAVLRFFLAPTTTASQHRCVRAPKFSTRTLVRGQTLTVERSRVFVKYAPIGGTPSAAVPFEPSTVVALVGPMRLLIASGRAGASLCG
jgi:hypothetical protein